MEALPSFNPWCAETPNVWFANSNWETVGRCYLLSVALSWRTFREGGLTPISIPHFKQTHIYKQMCQFIVDGRLDQLAIMVFLRPLRF